MIRRAAARFDRILVVGGGRAGVAAAEEVRRHGFAGELVVLHDETGAPYDRPACAKGVLTGHQRPADVALPVAEGTDVTWQLGRRAVHLDTARRTVHTDTGENYGYDGLVIATGGHARPPDGWPLGAPGLHVLYRLADAWALRADLRRANRVAVIGAGLTGSEVASAVRSLARECVLIDAKPYAMTRPLGEHVGRMLTDEMAREGVRLRL
ncbi:MAG TPA: FAD-dependent oxidoreductase, partial [Catenuloplanes sp.]